MKKNCNNCGNDNLAGLPIECAYKMDFINKSHGKPENIYCYLWVKKSIKKKRGK